jgi:hypothetical protein
MTSVRSVARRQRLDRLRFSGIARLHSAMVGKTGLRGRHEHRIDASTAAGHVRGEEPVRTLDPNSKRRYVLLRAELYERVRQLLQAEAIDPSLYEFEEPPNPS